MKRVLLFAILAVALAGTLASGKDKDKDKNKAAAAPAAVAVQPTAAAPAPDVAALAALSAAQQQGVDALIAAADTWLGKFPESQYREAVLLLEANAYRQKADPTKAQIAAERALQAKPDSYNAQLLLGQLMSQQVGKKDLDRDEKTATAQKHLNAAIEALKTAAKPGPQVSDQEWAQNKNFMQADAYSALGMLALANEKFDDAAAQFKASVEFDPQPANMVRMASAQAQGGKYDDAIATCDKVLADANLLPQIKTVATSLRAGAVRAKAAAKK
jgi:tetratricopeptide (TPR) repeat protein